RLDVEALRPVRDRLLEPDGLRAAFSALLTDPEPAQLIDVVVERCAERLSDPDPEVALAARATTTAAADFPGDVGAVVALLLNPVALDPGESIFLAAGNVHAYLRGIGIEIMANSDNVLRCGLTPKHVDVDELLEITDFVPLEDPVFAPQVEGKITTLAPGVADFALQVATPEGAVVPIVGRGPRIVLAGPGGVEVRSGGSSLALGAGQAVFVPASCEVIEISGHGRAFIAGVGRKT
ncbi:MAG: mannose-6-phosphate isomerase, class I, partial [Actinobacteria bacterium]|nr:mannose-6-phosphate isomerase, class I [Actinomycetota bacterium]